MNALGKIAFATILGKIAFATIMVTVALTVVWLTYLAQPLKSQAGIRTLILTNKAQLELLYGAPAVNSLLTKVNQFAMHSAVNGAVVLVEEIPAIADAYRTWQANPTDIGQANAVAAAIHALLVERAGSYPDLRYLVLLGDDRVLPHHRMADETTLSSENKYAQVPVTTTVGAAMASNLILTDDYYGDLRTTTPITFALPTIAVGRLVETPAEMETALARFLQNDGQILATNGLVVGHDFIADAAQESCSILSTTTLPSPIVTDCALIGNTWSGSQLDSKLRTSDAGVIFLYAGGSHWQIRAPTESLTSDLMPLWNFPPTGRLVYTVGGHDGLNVPPAAAQPFDWPQAWVARGAVYIGSTGYDYGYLSGIGLSEKLGILFARNLVSNSYGFVVGDALLAAKQTYVAEEASLNSYDHKIIAIQTLYGLPMYKISAAGNAPTATPTATGALIATATPLPNLDAYEVDDQCGDASPLPTDGTLQVHTFHTATDQDWVKFEGVAGVKYVITGQTVANSNADLVLDVYANCDSTPPFGQRSVPSDLVISFTPTVNGSYFVRATNVNAAVDGAHAGYQLKVSAQSSALPGAVILIPGRLRNNDVLQKNIHNVTNAVYQKFFANGYSHDRIFYLATEPALDATGDGAPDVDASATITNVRKALTEWALDKISTERPLTIYIMGNGDTDRFYVDRVNDQQFTTGELDFWLDQVEAAVPGVKINIIIDQCYAGSYITLPESLSKPGRLLIASSGTTELAYATTGGARFSDAFLSALTPGQNLLQAFQSAKSVTQNAGGQQVPELDGNGNGIPAEIVDDQTAQSRVLFGATTGPIPTPTWTPTTSPPTLTPTPTVTPSTLPTATPPLTGQEDAYEHDDSCAQAQLLATDGTQQTHNFHDQGDIDWLAFEVIAGEVYQVDVRTAEDSLADVQLQLYNACGGNATPHDALGPGVHLRVKAEANQKYYLSLANYDPALAGVQVTYQITVRRLADGPTPGALILVGGRQRANDELQPYIYEATNRVYRLFLRHGYTADRIYYLANDLKQDPDHNPQTFDVDALANRERLEYAITQWATDPQLGLGPERALTLYLMDHGDYDKFFLNGRNEVVGPDDLHQWLNTLEAVAPGVKVNVVIDACLSGSFIDPGKSLSKPGRVVITSASNSANAYVATGGGTVFTNAFVQALDRDLSILHAYAEAREYGLAWPSVQTAWIDDNGNGLANEESDGQLAQQRGFAFAGSLSSAWDNEAPYIAWVEAPTKIEMQRGEIRAQVRTSSTNVDVWAVIYEPTYTPPPPGEVLVLEQSRPTIRLEDPDGDTIYTGLYPGFDQIGQYRIVVYAVDESELQSRPRGVAVQLGSQIFLPVAAR